MLKNGHSGRAGNSAEGVEALCGGRDQYEHGDGGRQSVGDESCDFEGVGVLSCGGSNVDDVRAEARVGEDLFSGRLEVSGMVVGYQDKGELVIGLGGLQSDLNQREGRDLRGSLGSEPQGEEGQRDWTSKAHTLARILAALGKLSQKEWERPQAGGEGGAGRVTIRT